MRGRLVTIGLTSILATVLAVSAQQAATITLRSGAVVTGDLVDLGGAGFTVRVSGENREFRRDEVQIIDFGGPQVDTPGEAKTLAGGANLVLLRNGDVVSGEFYDVAGTSPLRLTFKTATGERVFESRDVRSIYMSRTDTASLGGPASAPGTPAGPAPAATVTVSARTAWTPTGITVRQGQTVTFSSTGEITFSPRNHKANPAGSVDNLFDSNAHMPSALQGALVGRIGAAQAGRGGGGRVFLIGNQTSVVMPAAGQLFLGVNDSGLNDNQGNFTVGVTPGN